MYSIKNLNLNNVKKNVSFKQNIYENYTTTALSTMQYINETTNENLTQMAKSIVDGMPIQEAVSIFMRTNIIIMDKTMDSIGKMIGSFSKELSTLRTDRKYFIERLNGIKDRVDELGNRAVTVEGFFYTETKQPNILLASEFKKGYADLIVKEPTKVYSILMNYYNSGHYMNTIRKDTLIQPHEVPDKLFRDKVFGFYRNNTTSESVAVYKASQIADAIRKYLDFDVYIDNLNELYVEIQSQVNEVKRCIELLSNDGVNLQTLNYVVYGNSRANINDDGYVREGFTNCVTAITKKKVSFITEFMSMYLLLIADKISAIKASINQNTVVLDSFYNLITLEEGE